MDLIKARKAIRLANFDASDLWLYKVKVLDDGDLEQNVEGAMEKATLLRASTILSTIFEVQSPSNYICIVACPPDRRYASRTKRQRLSSDAAEPNASDIKTESGPPYVGKLGMTPVVYKGTETDRLLELHKRFFGKPLPPALTALTEQNEKTDGDGNEDDDLLPQDPAPILDIGWKKILVRADYLRVYARIEEIFVGENERPAAVVTGQPGIGKTYWGYYALCRRIGQGADVLWYVKSKLYLFCREGVLEVPSNFAYSDFGGLWVIIDAAFAPNGIPPEMNNPLGGLFPIYISSPRQSRWSNVRQSWTLRLVLMNPWSRAEVRYAAEMLYSKVEKSEALRRYDSLGPTARLCLAFKAEDIASYTRERNSTMIGVIGPVGMKDFFTRLISDGSSLSLDFMSHKICLVQRVQGCPLSDSRFTVSPISPVVASEISLRLEKLKEEELLDIWGLFSNFGDARGMTGSIFEAYVQKSFRKRIVVHGTPMHQLPQAHTNPRWYASLSTNQSSSAGAAVQNIITLDLAVTNIQIYETTTTLSVRPNTYYTPQSGQQVALYSFIVHGGLLYIFQITGGKTHDINPGLIKFLASCHGLPANNNWRFVFVIPDDLKQFSCPSPKDPAIARLPLYTSPVPMS